MAEKKSSGESDAPQIKDPEVYEAIREDGASKEKAARIANAAARDGRETVGERGGESESYEDLSLIDI